MSHAGRPVFCSILVCLLLQQSPAMAAFEELYTTSGTGLDEGNVAGDYATYQMLDVSTGLPVADWRATVVATTHTVGFRLPVLPVPPDDPRIWVVGSSGPKTTTIQWESFDPGTTNPHPATYCINIADLDGSRTETVTVNKPDIFSYTLSVPTNVLVNDNGSTIVFTGTTDNNTEADAVRLCLKELSSWEFTFGQASGGDSAYSHDVDADFPFIGGVITNFGYTVTQSSGSPVLSESGSSVVFDVVLDYQPASNVVIDFSSDDPGEATVSPSRLTFTNGDWSVVQTVTVTGVDDSQVDGDQNTNITAAVNDDLSDNTYDPLGDVTITVTTTDDDTAGFTIVESGGSTSVSESGTTDTFSVVLDTQPVSDVVLDISSGDLTEVTVNPASLTFNNGDWDSAQTVSVMGMDDTLVDGNQNTNVTISVNAGSDGAYISLLNQTVSVSTVDDESNLSPTNNLPSSQSINEDGFLIFNDINNNRISIIDNAGENLVVTINVANGTLTLPQTAGLTFTDGDGTADATMIFSGTVEDINSALDGLRYDPNSNFNGNETLTISSSDGILPTDTDMLNIAVMPINDSPAGTVTIDNTTPQVTDTLTASNTLTDIDGLSGPVSYQWRRGGVDISGATGSTYAVVAADIGAVITVTASYTDDDGTLESVSSAGTAAVVSSGNFTISQSDGNTAVNESGTTDTFTVVLTVQPAGDVVIDISSGDVNEATVNPASLTFTNGNWNVARTVTVTGVNDSIIDGTQNTTITLSVNDAASDDNYDAVADKTVTASTADNDAAGFTLGSASGKSVNESGTTDTFTVVLSAQPDSNVVINVSSGDTGEATVGPASLTFTPGNWSTEQPVTVTGVNDTIIDGTQNTTITISIDADASDNNFDGLLSQTVAVTTMDNDAAGFTLSTTSVSVNESGTTDTFTVVLTAQPNSNVVISVSSSDTNEATVLATPALPLTFTPANWDQEQTVTVTGANDDLVDGNQNTTITVSVNAGSDTNFTSLPGQTVTATTVDNDAAGFTLSTTSVSVNESGTTDTFTVVLDAEPTSDVVINVSSGDINEATVSATPALPLTFTPGNWDQEQTVTVTGANDDLIDGNQNTTITVSVNAGSDPNFAALPGQTVTATTVDNDAAGFTVTETGGTSVNESGTTDTFGVVLNAQPASNVVIEVSSGDTGEASVTAIPPLRLTFTNGNWSTAQPVTVTGVDDGSLIDGDQVTAITLSIVDALSDNAFDALLNQTVNATTVDNDTAGFTIDNGGGVSVNESGTTDTFNVVLGTQPLTDVVIEVSSGDTGEASVTATPPLRLTFTNGNWSTAQPVTVTGVDDGSLIDGDQVTAITLSIVDALSDNAFDALLNQTVNATTVDNDTAGFTVTETGGTSVNESGTTDTFGVVLNAEPDGNVVINVSSGDTNEATVNPAILTFTPGDWGTAQAVTVTGVDDVMADGMQNVIITVSINDGASDDAFDLLPDQNVMVSVVDDETSLDADNDGIPNVVEGMMDTDLDGIADFLDTDSDDDGIPDHLEESNIPPLTGLDGDSDGIDDVIDVDLTGGNDANSNGIDDAFEPNDSDADGMPDYLDADSDDDGIPDGIEADNVPVLTGNDADGDGIDNALDVDLTSGTDSNSNGIDDGYEPRDSDRDGPADYLDIDSDNDGIHDSIEGDVLFSDSDGDGIDDRYDVDTTAGVDADGDGIDDNAAPDSDGDGRPDYRELDSDNDGLTDVTEAGLLDADGDGFVDNGTTTLSPLDTDFDGIPDFRELDSDNDGIFDIVAAGYTAYDLNNDGRIDTGFFVDPDYDGVPSVIDRAPTVFGLFSNGDGDDLPDDVDMDDDNDGIPDTIESPEGVDTDSDGDGVVDRIDRDSDNDGIPDSIEAFYSFELDSDLDGIIDDLTDTNLDGLADVVPASMIPEDTDGDSIPDYLDPDSDNDGLYDLLELTLADYDTYDANGDGRIDNPVDSDGDGLADAFDPDSGGSYRSFPILDSDNDGVANFRDADSDNDGFNDGIENGDFDNDGEMDFVDTGSGITTSISGGGSSFGLYWLWILLLFRRGRIIRKT